MIWMLSAVRDMGQACRGLNVGLTLMGLTRSITASENRNRRAAPSALVQAVASGLAFELIRLTAQVALRAYRFLAARGAFQDAPTLRFRLDGGASPWVCKRDNSSSLCLQPFD
jgi:hypothetical protein